MSTAARNIHCPMACARTCYFSALSYDAETTWRPATANDAMAGAPNRESGLPYFALTDHYSFNRTASGAALRAFLDILFSGRKLSENETSLAESRFGITRAELGCRCRLVEHLFHRLRRPGLEGDLAMWFTYRVYCDLASGIEKTVVKECNDPLIRIISRKLALDAKSIDGIRRYRAIELIRFGHWKDASGHRHSGGSRHTAAYRAAAQSLGTFVNHEIRVASKEKTGINRRRTLSGLSRSWHTFKHTNNRTSVMARLRRTRLASLLVKCIVIGAVLCMIVQINLMVMSRWIP